ncbi:molybdopterin molybdotransferase MoeA [Roseivirga sp.]|uniref:molybdopterin molybdotransferase MoeA n=1 Tax=Roseivirga sp. TaxID=1964215 RepID=UPI002B271D3F|nr:molybdopterin molybdotransferase MoeA [Roseivirga sp.]
MEFIQFTEALNIVKDHPFIPLVEKRELKDCVGLILNEDLKADRPFPPFDRVTMDGIAIAFSEFEKGQRHFKIEKTIPAGTPQYTVKNVAECVQIMTGAMMPIGMDTVIRYEDLTIVDDTATVNIETIKPQQNVHFKGMDRQLGDTLLKKGTKLGAPEMNIAAAIGKAELSVLVPPKAVIITTGDELVSIETTPAAHQIRRSGNYGIQALLNQYGVETSMHHMNDNKALMKEDLAALIETYQCIVLTGGVSKGKFDYLPEILDELGVQKHFHKVNQRPGKPFWFGTATNGSTIFALPGNPVSSFMCASVYIQAWINASLKITPKTIKVKLNKEVSFPRPLTYFLECATAFDENGTLLVSPFIGHGSGDFANLAVADGFVILPAEKSVFKAGEVYDFVPFRNLF